MAFIEPVQLSEGEHVVDAWLANRTQNQARAVGGRLTLTNQRLVFTPHALELALGGRHWESPLDLIRNVSISPHRRVMAELFSGGWRRRLAIESVDDSVELYVVNRAEELVAAFVAALPERAAAWTA